MDSILDEIRPYVTDEELEVVELAEQMNHGLTTTDAYFFGKILQSYGPKRVKAALLKARGQPAPLRYANVILMKGAMGKGRGQKQEPAVTTTTYHETEEIDSLF